MQTCPCYQAPAKNSTPPLFVRVMHCKFGQRPYSTKPPPPCAHLGQLKLLVSEIEFLTPFYGRSLRVVYAGAAPGIHMPILAQMFPTMHFVMVDPMRSMISNGEYGNIEVIQDLMTDALAAEYGGSLFISDVRVGPGSSEESGVEQQCRIQADMEAQQRWVRIMRPLSSILKFRLPWSISKKTEYLSGKIYFPVYGKQLTHEARLIVPRDALPRVYDNQRYERQMAYFNRVLRPAVFGGLCYDCTAFRSIVGAYLAVAGVEGSEVDKRCVKIERELERLKRQWFHYCEHSVASTTSSCKSPCEPDSCRQQSSVQPAEACSGASDGSCPSSLHRQSSQPV